jgi:hypothetical protein
MEGLELNLRSRSGTAKPPRRGNTALVHQAEGVEAFDQRDVVREDFNNCLVGVVF